MKLQKISARIRFAAIIVGLLPTACAFLEPSSNPLMGNWTTADRNQVTFLADGVVLTHDQGAQTKLKQMLVNPDYPVVDVTCDRGGTTYVMLDQHHLLAVYRDAGIGGTESYTRL
jgi:hypothetical protein